MIKRPENLLIKELILIFNFVDFHFLEIDLRHINSGKLGVRQNMLSEDEIISISKYFIHNEILKPSGVQEYGEENCSYYAKRGFYKKKGYKIVFCICSDRPKSIGIITLFRV